MFKVIDFYDKEVVETIETDERGIERFGRVDWEDMKAGIMVNDLVIEGVAKEDFDELDLDEFETEDDFEAFVHAAFSDDEYVR